MTRHCKSCRHLEADRDQRWAECMFWVDFAKRFPLPFAKVNGPTFRPMMISPRHVWDDLPTPPEIAALGRDFASEPWSEVMDCPQWEQRK